jgi:integrase
MARSTKGLYKRGNVWWMTYADASGMQQFESCQTRSQQEAGDLLIKRRNEALQGLLPDSRIKPLLLEDLFDRYLSFISYQGGAKTKRLHIQHFKRLLGNPPIHTLSVEVVDRYRGLRRGEPARPTRPDGPRISGATINREMATLKDALQKAADWKLVRKVIRQDLVAIKKYPEPPGRLRYLADHAEADRLVEACPCIFQRLVVTAIHTGMRKGELLGLTWDAVDLINGFIHLKQTKNGRARNLPINSTLRSVLVGLRTRIDVPWVFHDRNGRRITDRFKPFEGAVKKAGLVNFHFHDLRHTFASWLVMAGVPLAAVSELLGHTSLAMTMRYARRNT